MTWNCFHIEQTSILKVGTESDFCIAEQEVVCPWKGHWKIGKQECGGEVGGIKCF